MEVPLTPISRYGKSINIGLAPRGDGHHARQVGGNVVCKHRWGMPDLLVQGKEEEQKKNWALSHHDPTISHDAPAKHLQVGARVVQSGRAKQLEASLLLNWAYTACRPDRNSLACEEHEKQRIASNPPGPGLRLCMLQGSEKLKRRRWSIGLCDTQPSWEGRS